MKVLVTGAEEHQGLAVIRGLGLAGIPVVAAGSTARSLGFHSRFAAEHARYTSPFEDGERFLQDILTIASRTGAGMIIPAVESTLVALDGHRGELEGRCLLAAPPPDALEFAFDKWQTVGLAREVGVPMPSTQLAASPEEADRLAESFPYPVAIKPRGPAIYAKTRHCLGFKVRYAESAERLREIVRPLPASGGPLLIQALATGTGTCVTSVFDRGRPVAWFPYVRVRELPITGGISVVRKSIPLDERLRKHVEALLGRLGWHGIAMVEFKHDPRSGDYTLLEINGRFQASTALSLDAGLNLPLLVHRLHAGQKLDECYAYEPDVWERWLRGDWLSLVDHLSGATARGAGGGSSLPSRRRLVLDFLRDFRPGMHYDEFKLWDWRPGAAELLGLGGAALEGMRVLAGATSSGRSERLRSDAAQLRPAARGARLLERGLAPVRALRGRLELPALARAERRKDRRGLPAFDPGPERAIDEALAWLGRAQDCSASQDGGVAAWYSLVDGWSTSYPETTGYIVPTLHRCARLRSDDALRERARRMLDWLVSIQLPDGSFPGGKVGDVPVVGVTFNTGQILFGLASGVAEYGEAYRTPLRHAADWLVATQDSDGAWRKHPTPFAAPGEKAYETHVAWSLLEAERVEPNRGYRGAALANVRWALRFQRSNGWLERCCLSDPLQPLTHTLGYALRGILEAYRFSRDPELLRAACRTADGLAGALRGDGFLPGRLDSEWRGTVGWACLTGSVQIVHCWLQLYEETGDARHRDAALAANAFVRRTLSIDGPAERRGGVKGSFPVDGGYGAYRYLDWACKFFVDSNLEELAVRSRARAVHAG